MRLLCSLTGKRNPLLDDSFEPKDVTKWLGPPNLQLGLSSDQFQQGCPTKGQETLLAAMIAVLLQSSVIAIATVTVYHTRTRQAITSDPQVYGYPCYLAGSILLSLGIAICSFAVERSTVECDWMFYPRGRQKDNLKSTEASMDEHDQAQTEHAVLPDELDDTGRNHPRLLWLQQSQEVNDQSFDGYTILAGPKHHLITFSRIEDTELDHNSCSAAVATGRQSGNGPTFVSHYAYVISFTVIRTYSVPLTSYVPGREISLE